MHVKDASLFHGSDCSAGERGGLLDLSPMPVSRKRPRPRSNRRLRSPRLDSARHETFNMAREGEAMKTNGYAKIGNRIRRDLDGALSRLRQLGAVVIVMDRPGTIGESSPARTPTMTSSRSETPSARRPSAMSDRPRPIRPSPVRS